MFDWLDPNPLLAVTDTEYTRLLGFPPGHALSEEAVSLMEHRASGMRNRAIPGCLLVETGPLELGGGKLRIGGAEFASSHLHDRLVDANAHRGVIVLVSAGERCEQRAGELWAEEKPDEYFFLEMFGSAVAEQLVTLAGARICAAAEPNGLGVLPHYSPGYTGWELGDQVRLFGLLRERNGGSLPQGVRVMESGMLVPKKSLLAFFGVTRDTERARTAAGLTPCEGCAFDRCNYRRAPFRESRPLLEDVRRLQPGWEKPTSSRIESPVTQNASYSVNPRALSKWSRERLTLEFLPDGGVEACFRYEGTTCTNLGWPLKFDYRVKLDSPAEGYRILEARCSPASNDTGHSRMCAYLSSGENFLAKISSEQPLLGQPLEAVLNWARASNPAGCFCESSSREHKWGLVLEVLHYALAQREKTATPSPRG